MPPEFLFLPEFCLVPEASQEFHGVSRRSVQFPILKLSVEWNPLDLSFEIHNLGLFSSE